MKVPNKLVTYKESTLSKFPIVLKSIYNVKSISPYEIYKLVGTDSIGIYEYIEVLESLFALNKIDYNLSTGVVTYVQ